MFAEKLRVLGVVTHEEIKLEESLRGVSKPKKVVIEKKDERCHEKKVEGEKKSFVDVTKEPARRQGDALWLQVGGEG